MNIEDSLDPLGDIVQRSRQAQRETEQLRRALAASQDRRRMFQGELSSLRERLTRTLDRLDADGITNVDHVIHMIRKELER